MRPKHLKIAAALVDARAEFDRDYGPSALPITWVCSEGHTGLLQRDGATFVVAIGCAVPGRMPWWMCACVFVADGRSVDFPISEHEDEEMTLAVAEVFLREAPVPAELQRPPPAPAQPPEGSN